MKKYSLLMLLGIIILASVLRLWQLGNVPPSPDWDEAAIGYNAYSLLHTGKDEFGKFLPVVLRSFDDYKPALYAYLTIPSIALFGLNVFAVRLPSAIFGIIAVLGTYFLVKELFAVNKDDKKGNILALLAAFFMAISPWSLQFSRVGFESNVGGALNILMALFFVKGLKRPWLLSLSAIFAALAIYVYQSEKVFTPLLALALVLIYRKKLFSLNIKKLIFPVIVGLIFVLPMILFILGDKAALQRATGTSIFSAQNELLKYSAVKLEKDTRDNDKLGLILDNRRFVYATQAVSGYISHFDTNWLFFKGDIARHHVPGMGLLYLFELPLILFGIYMLIFGDFDKKTKLLVFAWFLIAPIPASITTGVPHAVRTLNFLPTWQIFSAIGLLSGYAFLSKYKLQILGFKIWKLLAIGLLAFAVFNFAYYMNQYFVQQNYYYSSDWQYGYKQAVAEVVKEEGNYKQIVISNDSTLDQSYIFFLFYTGFSPKDYQEKMIRNGAKSVNRDFGRFTFRKVDWEKDAQTKDTLFVVGSGDTPKNVKVIKTIYNLDGTVAIKIVKT